MASGLRKRKNRLHFSYALLLQIGLRKNRVLFVSLDSPFFYRFLFLNFPFFFFNVNGSRLNLFIEFEIENYKISYFFFEVSDKILIKLGPESRINCKISPLFKHFLKEKEKFHRTKLRMGRKKASESTNSSSSNHSFRGYCHNKYIIVGIKY